ncbi:RNA polymerase sigma factor [Roseateles sp. BYS87W]|uniref:RNA polymerase sigma factor n=1 Tax=Pelomonas baiyunensis TaxID=3299026 RepID=A0ABW7H1X6_9BURK
MPVEQLLTHMPALRRYARLLTGDATRADDLVQDTLERACRKWSLWRPGTALRPWLLSIMHNLHLNQLRDWRLDDGAAALDDVPDRPDPADAPAGLRLDLERALAALPDGQRAVMLLVVVEEYTYAEAADILGVPLGTVMSRLHRGRETLRSWLSTPASPLPPPEAETGAAAPPPTAAGGARILNLSRVKR